MNASDVREVLREHWPASEYLTIEEAPQDAMRQGRKLDLLVVSLWRSRGFDLDGVEIKVSLNDYRREIKDPAKADWWWEHVSRFWIAVPAKLVEQAREDLPETWGLLGVQSDGKVAVVVKAPRHDRTPLPWEACVGIMRCSSGAGANALVRAEARGRELGYKEGKRDAEHATGDDRLKARIEELEAQRAAFEEAAGISFDDRRFFDPARAGRLFKLVQEWTTNPDRIAYAIRGSAGSLGKQAEALLAIADEIHPEST